MCDLYICVFNTEDLEVEKVNILTAFPNNIPDIHLRRLKNQSTKTQKELLGKTNLPFGAEIQT